MLHRLALHESTVTDNPHFQAVLDAVKKTAGLRARVYSTFVAGPTHTEEFTFRTTSRDVHLKLGLLAYKDQLELARMLTWHFANCVEGQSQLMIIEGRGDGGALFTRTKEHNATIFTIAVAN